ncbi:MAG: lipocalin family protein [Gemmatimonadota bacterium]|nr:lipocalin family protein [Gemmatimonadota bacterium]
MVRRLNRLWLAFAFIVAGGHALPAQNAPGSEPETVLSVDLDRYMGLWYEFARLPNQFQRQCVRATTAEYSMRGDGRIDVVNRCLRDDGSVDEARGIARVVDETTNARLEVSFVRFLGRNLFWGDYWVVGLGSDYEYAIVGTPDRKYGWLLTREPEVSEDLEDEMFFVLEKKGYRHTDFVLSPQTR